MTKRVLVAILVGVAVAACDDITANPDPHQKVERPVAATWGRYQMVTTEKVTTTPMTTGQIDLVRVVDREERVTCYTAREGDGVAISCVPWVSPWPKEAK